MNFTVILYPLLLVYFNMDNSGSVAALTEIRVPHVDLSMFKQVRRTI